MKIIRRISKTKDIPLEQYGYYELEFDSKEELKEYAEILDIIKDIEKVDVEEELKEEFEIKGNFIKHNK